MSEKLNLLIVDDETEIREFLVTIIGSEFECQFTEANSGMDAVSKLNKIPFDLIITDFNMPNGSGTVVYEALKKLNCGTKFILATNDEKRAHPEITDDPKIGYLQKPFETPELIEIISQILEISKSDLSQKKYVNIPNQWVLDFEALPYDIYLKLGSNHQIRYRNANTLLSEDEKKTTRETPNPIDFF
jgi:DNA-binding NtrC family response regulator